MKKTSFDTKLFHRTFALAILLLAGGCGDSYDEANPFAGKWQEVACGNAYNPELTPSSSIIEFRSDGTYYGMVLFYGSREGETLQYRVESDSLRLQKEGYNDYIYRYTFTGKNQLLVQMIYGNVPYSMDTPTFFTFKRIK